MCRRRLFGETDCSKTDRPNHKVLGSSQQQHDNFWPPQACSAAFDNDHRSTPTPFNGRGFCGDLITPPPCGRDTHTCAERYSFLTPRASANLEERSPLAISGGFFSSEKAPPVFVNPSCYSREDAYTGRRKKPSAHRCDRCDRAYSRLSTLRQHVRACHSTTISKPHVCTICQRRFTQPSNLNAHLRTHTGLLLSIIARYVRDRFTNWGGY